MPKSVVKLYTVVLLKPLQMPLQLSWPHCFPDNPEAKPVFYTNYGEYDKEG